MMRRRRAVAGVLVALSVGSGVFWWRGRPERHLAWAEGAVREGDPDEALAWLAVPEATAGTRDRAFLLRARVAVERGRLSEAVGALEKVDPDGPSAADFAFWKARTLYEARQPVLAMNWFATALKRRPDHADSYRWLASAAYDVGNRSTAVSALETVTRLQPKDVHVWRTLGLIFKEDVDYVRARDAFERALALDRTQPAVRLELAETLLELGDVARAERELAACRGRVEEGRRAERLAECFRMRGDLAGLRATVAAGLATAPDRPGLLAEKAQIDLADGRPAEALERLDRAVEADPYRAATIYQRGVVLRLLGRGDEAVRDFARAEALNKGLAEMSALNQQAERAPRDADIRYRLGRLCADLGKPELAASWYRAALACDPKHAAARFELGLNTPRPSRRGVGSRP
jgi:tetratricopeptide (TPR) repeat protein